MLRELIKYKDLLLMLAFRDIRIRYKQAAMGFMTVGAWRAMLLLYSI